MKAFVCGDLVPGCDAAFEADSEEELLVHIVGHARDAHGMHEVPPEVMDTIKATITDR
jgi:predicted small metal-binding protein